MHTGPIDPMSGQIAVAAILAAPNEFDKIEEKNAVSETRVPDC